MTDNFTLNDDRAIQDALAEHKRVEEELLQLRLLEQQRQLEEEEYQRKLELEEEYERGQEFLKNVDTSLTFTQASTALTVGTDGQTLEVQSLFKSVSDYAEAAVLLSGNFDEDFGSALKQAHLENGNQVYSSDVVSAKEFKETANTVLLVPEVDEGVKDVQEHYGDVLNVTVSDIVNATQDVTAIRESYHIPENDVVSGTVAVLHDQIENNQAYVLTHSEHEHMKPEYVAENDAERVSVATTTVVIAEEALVKLAKELYDEGYRAEDEERLFEETDLSPEEISAVAIIMKHYEEEGLTAEAERNAFKEIEEENIPVQVTFSDDGYVMNTSEEITAQNVDQYNEKVENGNEYKDVGVPKETTVDISEVGGKIKLEEANELGSIEEEQDINPADLNPALEDTSLDTEKTDKSTRKKDDYERD